MIRAALSRYSPGGAEGCLTILIFHRIHAVKDPLDPSESTAAEFSRICGWLARWMNILPLDEAILRLREGSLPARAGAITFDDGYKDNFEVALPILQRHGLSATFFIATGFSEGGSMWNDLIIEAVRATRAEQLDLSSISSKTQFVIELKSVQQRQKAIESVIPRVKYFEADEREGFVDDFVRRLGVARRNDLMMTPQQLRILSASGMLIGGHSVSHPILRKLSREKVRRELAECKMTLEGWLDHSVTLFAYPNGKQGIDFDVDIASQVAQAGFAAAVTTEPGVARSATNAFHLPRYTPWARSRSRFGLQLVNNIRHSRTDSQPLV